MRTHWGTLTLGLAACVGLTTNLQAQDTIRLGGRPAAQEAPQGNDLRRLDLRPQDTEEDDTQAVHLRFHGGFRGYYGGFYGGGYYGGAFRGFYPSYYGGFHRGFYPGFGVGVGFYQPSFYAVPRYSFYSPVYSGFTTSSFYGGFYPGYYGGFCPIGATAATIQVAPQVVPLRPSVPPMNPNLGQPVPAPQNPGPRDGFRYDGGPANPVPLPQGGTPEAKPEPMAPMVSDRAVSLPGPRVEPEARKFSYPAYGEQAKPSKPAPRNDGIIQVKGTPTAK